MRIMLAFGIAGLSLLASCASCNQSRNANGSGTANANVNSNDNRAPLAIATPPPELAPSSTLDPSFKECNSYLPLIPGSQARYSLVYSTGLQASPIIVVDQTTENGVTVFVQKTQIVDKSGGLNKNEMLVQKYVCDRGRIKVVAETSDNSVEGHKTTMEMHYAEPAYVMLEPGALKPGATWSYSFTQTFQNPEVGTTNSERSSTFSCKVEGEEEVAVPAGNFKTIKVAKKIGKTDIFEYYARGIGLVKRVNGDGTTWTLMSYSGLKPGA